MVFIGKIIISVFATEMLAISKESADFLFFKKYIKNKKVQIVPNAIQLDMYNNISNEEIMVSSQNPRKILTNIMMCPLKFISLEIFQNNFVAMDLLLA
jgi:hypothetical protein